MGITLSFAFFLMANCCQGIKFEWCSSSLTIISSSSLMFCFPHVYITRFIASVAFFVKMISFGLVAFMNFAVVVRVSSNACVAFSDRL